MPIYTPDSPTPVPGPPSKDEKTVPNGGQGSLEKSAAKAPAKPKPSGKSAEVKEARRRRRRRREAARREASRRRR